MRRLNSRQHAHEVPPPGGLTRTTRLLLVATPFLLALLAPTTLEAQRESDGRRAPAVGVGLSAAVVNVCPGREPPAQVRLRAEGDGAACSNARYTWSATGGRIKGEGPKVVWDFEGTQVSGGPRERNYYEVTLTVEGGPGCAVRRAVSAPARVVVWGCTTTVESRGSAVRRAPAAAPCPNISLCCHSTVGGNGVLGPFIATLGDTHGVKPTFDWKLSAGRIYTGAGTSEITIDAKGVKGGTVLATVEVGGYAPRCSATCLATLPGGANLVPTHEPTSGRLATLSVSVKSSRDERYVPGATLKFYRADGEFVGQAEKVPPGPYVRGEWTPGEYRVEVSANNYGGQVASVTLAPLSTGSVAFTLKPTGPPVDPSPVPPAEPAPPATLPVTPSPSPTVTPTPDPVVGPTTPTPARSWISKSLFADVQEGANWPWLLLGAVVGLAVAGYLLLLKLLGRGAGGALTRTAGPSLGASAEAAQEADEVHCTVYAPTQAAPGTSFMVVAFAHLAEQAELLAAEAKKRDAALVDRGSEELEETVARGEELTFQLQTMPALEIDEPSQSFKWKGRLKPVEFFVKLPKTFEETAVNCKLLVLRASVPIGHVKFRLEVTAAASAAKEAAPEPRAFHRYRNAFISYDSDDRSEVLRRVQMLDVVGISYFQDVLSLKPGERWEKQLYKHIDDCDVVFLFWSVSARESEWVEKEVKYALEHRQSQQDGLPEIVPVILDGPREAPPPAYLSEYHFNDKFDYFIQVEDAARAARAARPEASGQA